MPNEGPTLQTMIEYIFPVGDWLGANVPKVGIITLGVIAAAMGDRPIYPGRDMPDSSVPVVLSGDGYFDGRTLVFSATAAAEMIDAVQSARKD